MAQHVADEIHPAFSNLFVQTEIIRAPRDSLHQKTTLKNDPTYWNFHLMALHGKSGECLMKRIV